MYKDLKSSLIKLSAFWKNEHGSIAVIYGFTGVMLLVTAGVAVDYARGYLLNKELSRALDAAVLAASTTTLTDADEINEFGNRYFQANITQKTRDTYNPVPTIELNGTTIEGQVAVVLPTSLTRFAGFSVMPISTAATVERTLTKVEVAIAFDVSASMLNGGKIDALRESVNDLLDSLFAVPGSEEYTKVALVPFSSNVNHGRDLDTWWIDKQGVSTAARQDTHNRDVFPHHDHFWTFWQGTPYEWTATSVWDAIEHFDAQFTGCFRAREGNAIDPEMPELGPMEIDETDIPPNPDIDDTLFAPFFHDFRSFDIEEASEDNPEFSFEQLMQNRLNSTEHTCKTSPVTPLTDDVEQLKRDIDNSRIGQATNIVSGFTWAWRVLSPGTPYTDGAPYGGATTKILVLMTDGMNDIGPYSDPYIDQLYGPYGQHEYGNLWLDTDPQFVSLNSSLNTKTDRICRNIKAKDIIVATITFDLDDVQTKEMIERCASEGLYYDADDISGLQTTFETIAGEIHGFRLAR